MRTGPAGVPGSRQHSYLHMPYIALYRKYRSQTFDDVIGQEHVTRTIQNAIQRGKLGQAYLFTGQRGTGKTTVARLLAKAVNCEQGPTATPCNQCSMCLAITQGSAVDVSEVDAASNRGVAEMESICESVRYQPMEARYRVVILDEAHQLSDHAKDAFLKTLEEPPPHALFVLATTEPSKIPITIRSRCQQFDFHRGTPKEVEERLRQVCSQEGVNISDGALRILSGHAQGSWRDGLSLLEQVIAFAGTDVDEDATRQVLGAVPSDITEALLSSLLDKDADGVLQKLRESWEWGADPSRLLSALVEAARLRLEHSLTSGNQGQARGLLRLVYHLAESEAGLRDWERADLAIEVALLSAISEVSAAAEPTVAAPAVASAPATPPPAQAAPAAPAKSAPRSAEPTPPAEPAHAAPEAPSAPAAAPDGPGDLQMMIRAWPRVIQHLRSNRANTSLCAILKDGQPSSYDAGTVTITFPESHRFHVQRAEQPAARSAIEDAFKHVTGLQVRIQAASGDTPAAPATSRAPQAQAAAAGEQASSAEQKNNGDGAAAGEPGSDLVEKVLQTFGGEVLDDQDPFTE